ncbi:MAG: hypothetical protein MJA27_34450 [Pseudanabaenales cyanobacterium]|nr:hypothetical protein [Pseudanabaenales cyanobacterium]
MSYKRNASKAVSLALLLGLITPLEGDEMATFAVEGGENVETGGGLNSQYPDEEGGEGGGSIQYPDEEGGEGGGGIQYPDEEGGEGGGSIQYPDEEGGEGGGLTIESEL